MAKALLTWLVLSIAIGAGISAWRSLSGKEQWQLTKIVAYATMCSLSAVMLLGLFVLLF